MGLLTAFVGFASSFAVVLQGLRAVGATETQAASGLMALSISMGLCAVVFSIARKLPISIAWSTPGAALLASAGAGTVSGGFEVAVGAFIVCACLIIIAGLWRPFGKAVAAIPASLANAMLLSAWTGNRVSLPLDEPLFEEALQARIATSKLRTPADVDVKIDMDKSYR